MQTDRNRQVADNNLTNNIAYDPTPMEAKFAPPADLIVSTINVPATGAPGDKATIQWSVKNQGANPAVGQWTDAVYLSKDTTWDSNDAVIGRVDHIGDIAKDATYNGTLNTELPAVLPGEYYVIVRTDVRNFVRENDDTNNAGASSAKVKLDVTELTLGVAQSGTLSFGQERYYKVNAPANETLRFTLDGNRDNKPQQPANELYARFGLLPSRSAYDFLFHRPYEPDQEIVVPDTQAGTYYSLARNAYLPANAQTDPYSIKAEIVPFGITSVSPNRIGDNGQVTITIKGAKFETGSIVQLVKGATLLTATNVLVVDSVTIKAKFLLTHASQGIYDVVVKKSGSEVAMQKQFVTVESSRVLSATITGNGDLLPRLGRTFTWSGQVENSSNIDIEYLVVSLSLDQPLSVEIDLPKGAISFVRTNQISASKVFILKGMASGEKVNFAFRVREYQSPFNYSISSKPYTKQEYFDFLRSTADQMRNQLLGQSIKSFSSEVSQALSNPDNWWKLVVSQLATAGLIDATEVSNFTNQKFQEKENILTPIANKRARNFLQEQERSALDTCLGDCDQEFNIAYGGELVVYGICMAFAGPTGVGIVACTVSLIAAIHVIEVIRAKCKCDCYRDNMSPTCGTQGEYCRILSGYPCPRSPQDPNDKQGPTGYGLLNFTGKGQEYFYTVNFENIPTASANAQRIRITDKLDPNLDWRTFRLKEIGFGKYRIPIPDNRAFYQGRLQLGEDLGNLVADISAGLDIATGQVTWTLTALDPKTGEQPNGANQGLLPPNDSTGRGQGYVTYTVQPKADVKTGTVIANSATIIFDTEEPITTNTVTNTIDADAPTSAVNALPATSSSRTFTVSWAGSDPANGSGLQSFDVWYAEGDGAYQPLLSGTTDTSTNFTGQAGKSYRFYSIARDNAGNVETAPATPDAVTTIGQVNNPAPTLASLSPNALLAGANAFTLTVTGANFVPESQVLWNGAARTTSYVSPTEVTATISATDVASASAATVTVTNPTPGGGTSAALSFAIQALGYEADVAPRPLGNGNGLVTILDWVQMGRFAAGLDTPAVGSEFQRADCAPRPTLGDGRITVSDWVQAGRYAAGLDSVFVLGGFTAPTSPPPVQFGEATASVLRIGTGRFTRGQVISLPIELDAQGTESGVAFSLNYDPKLMSFLDATLGTGASGGALQVNTSQAVNGRVGIAFVLPAGQQIAMGTKAILNLRFLPSAGETEVVANVTFGDQIIPREITDVRAFALAQVNYVNGTVTLSGRGAATVPGASYVGVDLAPDSIVSSFGTNLTGVTLAAPSLPLPTTLGGTTVTVKDSKGVERLAELFYVSPLQINFLIPKDTAEGIATVSIQSASGEMTSGVLHIGKLVPALFAADATGQGIAAASVQRVKANGSSMYEAAYTFDAQKKPVAIPIDLGPESEQVYLLLFGSGLRLREALSDVVVTIGGVPAEVVYAGPQGSFVGLDQINVKLPRSLAGRKDVDVVVTVAGKTANTVQVSIK